ncbi:oligoendopeptidase F [Candidatus Bipolaricaulota bacterium]|nr:oligoendopeptidase F [Candidatus Bipolaricaulota bacterium]
MSQFTSREKISTEYKWDLERMFAGDGEWEEELEEVGGKMGRLEKYEGRLAESPETLLAALNLRSELFRRTDKLFAYARMRSDEDTRVQEHQAMTSQARGVHSKARSAASFIEPELQSLTREELEEMAGLEEELAEYRHYFDDIMRLKPHTRSAEVEGLLADLSEVLSAPGEIFNYLTNADLDFPSVTDRDGEEVKITLSNFVKLLKRDDRDFRERVYSEFYDVFGGLSNTFAVTYSNSLKGDTKLAHAKNYESTLESSLDKDNIPIEVYENLIGEVNNGLGLLHRHVELKKESLGIDELNMWDLYVPSAESNGPEISYEEAKEYVLQAISPLGEEYRARVEDGFSSRWVDVYENPGKRAGAYSWGTYDTQPYVLLNFQNDISSLYTLAHELGHSMHSVLTKDNQPYHYSDYSIFIAEVASTCHEALLTEYLLDNVQDRSFRRHVLDNFLEGFRATFFRQALFSEFEHEAHGVVESGEGVTAQRLNELFGSLKEKYYEPAEIDERIRREWMRIPHFYRPYYVYQYSTGITVALAMAKRIIEGGKEAAEQYKTVLNGGSSDYPMNLLRDGGVDLTKPKPIREALSLYGQYLDEMSELI